jgi:hypothetical protein
VAVFLTLRWYLSVKANTQSLLCKHPYSYADLSALAGDRFGHTGLGN